MRQIGVIILLILSGFKLLSQTDIKQYIDTTHMWIGDQQNLNFESNKDIPLAEITTVLDTLSWFQIIDKSPSTKNEKGRYISKIIFTVFDSGNYQIPNLLQSSEFNPNANYVEVRDVPDQKQELLAIKDIEETTAPSKLTLYIILASILALIMLGILWFFFRADRVKPGRVDYITPPKPYEIAFQKIKELESKKLWQRNELKEYYTDINFILREFISDGLNIPAKEHTSREIIHAIEESQEKPEHFDQLQSSLKMADYAKYANKFPDISEHQSQLEFVTEFIQKNIPLSNKILNDNQICWSNLLQANLANQFDNPLEIVPEILQNNISKDNTDLILISGLFSSERFELPETWVRIHRHKLGQLTRWHHNLLSQSKIKFISLILILICLPVIAIFLPVLAIVAYVNKESLFSRGLFLLTSKNKLVIDKSKL